MGKILFLLFLVFLTLKLAQIGLVANWSWWYVTVPLWIIPAALLSASLLAVFWVSAKMFFHDLFDPSIEVFRRMFGKQ